MIRIWGRPTSICTMRALWALEEVGRPYELTLASATMGPAGHVSKGGEAFGIVTGPEYLAMNPNGTVPTIRDGDEVLWESNAIVLYLAMRYAPEKLYGGDVSTLARACQWMSWTNEHLEPRLHTLVMEVVRLPAAERSAAAERAACEAILKPLGILERHLARSAYVAGPAFTLGDITVGCAVHRWTVLAAGQPALPAIAAWLARLGLREGYRRHVAPSECHLAG